MAYEPLTRSLVIPGYLLPHRIYIYRYSISEEADSLGVRQPVYLLDPNSVGEDGGGMAVFVGNPGPNAEEFGTQERIKFSRAVFFPNDPQIAIDDAIQWRDELLIVKKITNPAEINVYWRAECVSFPNRAKNFDLRLPDRIGVSPSGIPE